MIKGLAHVCISAKDLAATERFYVTGLGLKKGFDFIRNGQNIGFYLELGRLGFIEVFKRDEVDAKANGPIQHLCIEVDDIDRLVQQLTAHGYEATPKKLGADQSWQSWTTDPSGVRIEFHQYTALSSQTTGQNCLLK